MLSNMIFLMIFCGFWSVAVNTVDKLQFLVLILLIVAKCCVIGATRVTLKQIPDKISRTFACPVLSEIVRPCDLTSRAE